MISVKLNPKDFINTLQNTVEYSMGFIDGAKISQTEFNKVLADATIESLNLYIDANARENPASLHHVYEWDYIGNPQGRLFNFDAIVTQRSITITSSFLQSTTVKKDATSSEPFWNKAEVMESGMTVVIVPRRAEVLAYQDEDSGEIVFTEGPVVVNNPGGFYVHAGFASAVKTYFDAYYKDGFLKSTGILERMKNPAEFRQYYSKNSKRSQGVNAGRQYMTKPAGVFE